MIWLNEAGQQSRKCGFVLLCKTFVLKKRQFEFDSNVCTGIPKDSSSRADWGQELLLYAAE